MDKIFYAIHRFVEKNKLLSCCIAVAFLLITGFFTSKIKFEEDITRIIPKNEKTTETAKVLQQLNFTDKIAVIIEKDAGGTEEDMIQMAQQFLDTIPVASSYIKSIQGAIDESFIQESFDFAYRNLPLFLEESDYKTLENKIRPDSLKQRVADNFEIISSPSGIVAKDFIVKDPLGLTFIALKRWQQMNMGGDMVLENGFLFTKDKSKILLFINPVLKGSETEQNTLFAAQLYGIQNTLNQHYSGKASIDYFGSSLIAVANAKQIKTDILTTVLISMGALMLILMIFYKRILIPILIFIPSVFGALTALTVLYFVKDSISAISVSIGAILLGITIDYSLHILTHYKSNSDIKALYKEITKPLIMSGTTTAVAFICLLFVKSEALIDLGIFASLAVIISALFSLLIIPHLYKPASTESSGNNLIDKMAKFSFHSHKGLLGISIVLIIISCFTYSRVHFDADLSKLNFIPESLQKAEQKLTDTEDKNLKALYITSYGHDIEKVLTTNHQLNEKLKQEDSVIANLNSVSEIILSQSLQKEKIERWNAFWKHHDRTALEKQLVLYGQEYGFKPETHIPFYQLLQHHFTPLTVSDFRKFNSLLFDEFITDKAGFYTVSTIVKVPFEKRDEFVNQFSETPHVMVIDRQQMSENFLGELVHDFNALINYSFIAVLLILWLFFRRIELVIISAIPIGITGLVTAGLMGIFDIPFNIFSSIVCTLVFGHGVDFSIFMTSALQKQYSTGKNELQTYRTSILLAVLTTILAIGALIFAEHPALKSISLVSLIGVFAALIITFVFYPILFRIVISNRPDKGKSPVSLLLFVQTVVFFIYYSIMGVFLSLMLRFFLWIIPASKEKKYKWFGKAMSLFMKSVLHLKPTVTKKLINIPKDDFKKPAIIIANHTSFLDTLAIGMYNPNIVFLVNDWVWKSPIFGRAVRLAGFYPVSQGIDGSVEHLRQRMGNTFSLMIFPEGTRSYTNEIQRFHKGAFYLAEKLQLDILPVYIHGNSEVIPKGDFIIYDGQIIDYIGERISITDERYGSNYTERTKQISRHFRETFEKVRHQLEDENYFKKKLFLSFLYKETEINKAVRKDFQQHKSVYHELNSCLGKKEKIVHFADDYGQLDFLLLMQQAGRNIQTYMADTEKRAVAATNYITKIRNLVYLDAYQNSNEKQVVWLFSTKTENVNIPDHVQKIALLLSAYDQYIPGFSQTQKTEKIIVLERNGKEGDI